MTIDVIIPAYKPGNKFIKLLQSLASQDTVPGKIIVINTEEKYWPEDLCEQIGDKAASLLEVHHILKEEFDHGHTRNVGISYSDADIVVLMTDDAVPYDNFLLSELASAFSDEKTGAAYARQLASFDATIAEKFSREFNYPDEPSVKGYDDLKRLGIKTFFCSNVCAAYRHDLFDKLGGFVDCAIFNEDMIFASQIIDNGYLICYCNKAKVIHSHSYKNKEQLHRNFDIAVSQMMNPEVFDRVSSESEGLRYIYKAMGYFVKAGRPLAVVPFMITSVYKYYGYKMGKKYKTLSHDKILKLTMNPRFFLNLWEKEEKGK